MKGASALPALNPMEDAPRTSESILVMVRGDYRVVRAHWYHGFWAASSERFVDEDLLGWWPIPQVLGEEAGR
jgi:hypothetical protein